jgi:hypothetical protein
MIRDLEESARNIIKNCLIPAFKGMLTGTCGSLVGRGTRRLQVERSRARFPVRLLDFSVYAILPSCTLAQGFTAFDRYESWLHFLTLCSGYVNSSRCLFIFAVCYLEIRPNLRLNVNFCNRPYLVGKGPT